MKITYDPEADAIYVYLLPPEQAADRIAETVEAAPNVMLDRDREGRVVGIEIQGAGGLSVETLARPVAEVA